MTVKEFQKLSSCCTTGILNFLIEHKVIPIAPDTLVLAVLDIPHEFTFDEVKNFITRDDFEYFELAFGKKLMRDTFTDSHGNYFCVNCSDCIDCSDCKNCSNCVNCTTCFSCEDCYDCSQISYGDNFYTKSLTK